MRRVVGQQKRTPKATLIAVFAIVAQVSLSAFHMGAMAAMIAGASAPHHQSNNSVLPGCTEMGLMAVSHDGDQEQEPASPGKHCKACQLGSCQSMMIGATAIGNVLTPLVIRGHDAVPMTSWQITFFSQIRHSRGPPIAS